MLYARILCQSHIVFMIWNGLWCPYLTVSKLFADDIVERYDNLSKLVSDRNEKLQVTLTRSLSVQDGLDEMMNWMKKVEESVEGDLQVPLDSTAIADALSKEAVCCFFSLPVLCS